MKLKFRILFNEDEFPSNLYKDYSKFLLESIKKDIRKSVNFRRYKVREPFVLESSIIKWNNTPPSYLNLIYYINNALVLKKERNVYYITLNSKLIQGSSTPISTLIRLLEFGNEKIPPYPLIRTILMQYQLNYKSLMFNYVRERMMNNESVSIRRSTRERASKYNW